MGFSRLETIVVIQSYKDYEYDKRTLSQERRVMPYDHEKKKQLLCEDNLRHNEYYGMQNTIDNLYQASLNGEVFTDLMSVILQRENILLAYRNIKKNTGSKTSGTDNLTIEDIGRCSPMRLLKKLDLLLMEVNMGIAQNL